MEFQRSNISAGRASGLGKQGKKKRKRVTTSDLGGCTVVRTLKADNRPAMTGEGYHC